MPDQTLQTQHLVSPVALPPATQGEPTFPITQKQFDVGADNVPNWAKGLIAVLGALATLLPIATAAYMSMKSVQPTPPAIVAPVQPVTPLPVAPPSQPVDKTKAAVDDLQSKFQAYADKFDKYQRDNDANIKGTLEQVTAINNNVRAVMDYTGLSKKKSSVEPADRSVYGPSGYTFSVPR